MAFRRTSPRGDLVGKTRHPTSRALASSQGKAQKGLAALSSLLSNQPSSTHPSPPTASTQSPSLPIMPFTGSDIVRLCYLSLLSQKDEN